MESVTTCRHCGDALPPSKRRGKKRVFCRPECTKAWNAEHQKCLSRARGSEPKADRAHFAGSTKEFASRYEEIQKTPALRAALERLRKTPPRCVPMETRFRELEASRWRA